MESFSERLVHLRHSNNLTRQQVRESLNINNVSTYNRWENGSRTPDNETIEGLKAKAGLAEYRKNYM